MFERFTDRARKTMSLANQQAQQSNHSLVRSEHVLLGLIKEGSGVGVTALANRGVNLVKMRLDVEKFLKSAPNDDWRPVVKLPQTIQTKRVIEYAIEEARNFHHTYVGTEHLLLGLCHLTEGIVAQVFDSANVSLDNIRDELKLLWDQWEQATGNRVSTLRDRILPKAAVLDGCPGVQWRTRFEGLLQDFEGFLQSLQGMSDVAIDDEVKRLLKRIQMWREKIKKDSLL